VLLCHFLLLSISVSNDFWIVIEFNFFNIIRHVQSLDIVCSQNKTGTYFAHILAWCIYFIIVVVLSNLCAL